jgi:hypothetical protein
MRAGREDPLLGCRLPARQFGGPYGPHPAAAAVAAAAPDGDTLAVVFDAFESGVTAEPATQPGAKLHPASGIDDEALVQIVLRQRGGVWYGTSEGAPWHGANGQLDTQPPAP